MGNLNLNHNNNQYINKLKNGICEVVHTDTHSVEHINYMTRSLIHLPDSFDENHKEWKPMKIFITVWNVTEESWQKIYYDDIVHIEQLTGMGAKANENKTNNCLLTL
jgi:hypothetical protein